MSLIVEIFVAAALTVVVLGLVTALVASPSFRKDFLEGKSGTAKVLDIISVEGAAILIVFASSLGGLLYIVRDLSSETLRGKDSTISGLQSTISALSKSLDASAKTISDLQAQANRLVFRPIDEADPPYCDGATPKAVPLYDEKHRPNLALLAQARSFGSSLIGVAVTSRHAFAYVNDGWYGNCRSWIADRIPAWTMVDLGGVFQITGVALGSDNSSGLTDRAPQRFKVEVATNNTDWRTVLEAKIPEGVHLRKSFDFDKTYSARLVRLMIYDSTAPIANAPGAVRIDEFEIFGEPQMN